MSKENGGNFQNMSLRDAFALAAMQALLSNWQASQKICDSDPRYQKQADGLFNFADVVALNAYEFSDAMLKVRKQ